MVRAAEFIGLGKFYYLVLIPQMRDFAEQTNN